MAVHYAIAGMEAPCGVHHRRQLVLSREEMRRHSDRRGGFRTALATQDRGDVTCSACRRAIDYAELQERRARAERDAQDGDGEALLRLHAEGLL